MILYETLSQPKTALLMCMIGFVCGFLFDFLGFCEHFFKKKKFYQNLSVFIGVFLSFVIFDKSNLLLNYGNFRFFPFFCFFSSLLIERFTLGKLIDFLFNKCYNFFVTHLKAKQRICKRKRKN